MAALFVSVTTTKRKKEYRENTRYLNDNLTPRECRERYRFSPDGIDSLCDILHDKLQSETERSHALSVKEKVLIALRYYATGSFMQTVGDTLGRDKSTVSRIIASVTNALCDIKDQYIKWPSDTSQNKSSFYRVSGFPNVIGCIDGTHVQIIKPGGERQRAYINRKRFPSINVMGVVDHSGKFISVNAK
ncbi:putative nuclease HARBI1 [Ruditapes philippinarum]|uniref:putative nuclease HARBI1 n=1 Tax=Ruditapes philippinarum TaxID=129788 RepID=UPI00295A8936|nr:putative nuclease HARBI1 [Ruditapes philippinarum]